MFNIQTHLKFLKYLQKLERLTVINHKINLSKLHEDVLKNKNIMKQINYQTKYKNKNKYLKKFKIKVKKPQN